jgi:hypothetical protein
VSLCSIGVLARSVALLPGIGIGHGLGTGVDLIQEAQYGPCRDVGLL